MVILPRDVNYNFEKFSGSHSDFLRKEKWELRYRYGSSDFFDVPCGHCINCRLNYAKKWSQRCLLETKSWQENWFVTLTYDDDHLPAVIDRDTGEFSFATLVPDDVTAFMKRLREFYRDKFGHTEIRFYMAGEYGDTTFRPHYHILLFNVPCFDLKYYSKSPLGDCYYNSDTFNKLWGKGHVVIGEVTAQSAAYVARYCQKKAGKKIDYDAIGVRKEYVNMSRRPGIALPYFMANYEKIYKNDTIYLPNGQMATPMRYFDDKAAQCGIDIEAIKKKRMENADLSKWVKAEECSTDYYDLMAHLEDDAQKSSKIFKRSL